MSEISTSQKIAAASRVAGRYAGRSRTLRAAREALSGVLHSFARIFRRLWHEIVGFFFFVFSLIGVLAIYREYRKYSLQTPHPSAGPLIAAVAFTVVFVYFSASSFWRAKAGGKAGGPGQRARERK